MAVIRLPRRSPAGQGAVFSKVMQAGFPLPFFMPLPDCRARCPLSHSGGQGMPLRETQGDLSVKIIYFLFMMHGCNAF